jgi:hypothetical protein
LPLSAGQGRPAGTDHGVVAVLEPVNKLIDTRASGRAHDVGARRVRPPVLDVLEQRCLEEQRRLKDEGDLVAE